MLSAGCKAVLIVAVLVSAPRLHAQGAADGAAVKARVALAVARFAEFPAEREPGALRLCLAVRGKAPGVLMDLAREKVGTHAVEVTVGPPFTACDVIYMHSNFVEWRQLLAGQHQPALTVGDVPGFLAAGGMIELLIDNDTVRFDVNLSALRGKNIRLPSQVLKLARQVRN
jgi:hypothetical protein